MVVGGYHVHNEVTVRDDESGVDLGAVPSRRGSPVMGFFSWVSSCGTVGEGEPSLVQTNVADPELSDVQRRAAEDVARIQQDDKYFHRNDDGGL
jgi:hypothetical protein